MTKRYVAPEPECSDAEFEERVATRNECPVLDDVVEATETGISDRDFSASEVKAEASFDLSTREGQIKWIVAQNAAHKGLIGSPGMEITVTDWVCWKKDVVRPNGEIDLSAWVMCLWTDDGNTISTASELTVKQWANVARALRSGKLSLPIRVKLTPNSSKIKGGNPWYSIIPDAQG